jgi:hypothetical protein
MGKSQAVKGRIRQFKEGSGSPGKNQATREESVNAGEGQAVQERVT